MKKLTATLAALILTPMLAFASPEIGTPAPDFTGKTAAGIDLTLSDHKGSIVVLEWTNHQCPFVKKYYQNGDMQKLQKDITEKGVKWVRVISSAIGKQGHLSAEDALKNATAQGVAATATVIDEAGTIGQLYGAKTTPHLFVIAADGTLAYKGAIDSIASADPADIAKATPYVKDAVMALKAGKAVEPASTNSYGCSIKY